jgi:TIR domain
VDLPCEPLREINVKGSGRTHCPGSNELMPADRLWTYSFAMYKVAIIQIDRKYWADELEKAIDRAAQRHTGVPRVVSFSTNHAGADLVLCLGSLALAQDPQIESQIADAVAREIRVLPVVSDLARLKSEVPPALLQVNGMAWGSAEVIAEEVLRHLGLTERDRRVFLSYFRKEATPLAYQLYDELNRRRFSVFLDVFDIDHGEFVQGRIVQAIQHTSFVLLLYSPGVENSEWIEKEINLALTQDLGLMALAFPGAATRPPFGMVPNDLRLELTGKLAPGKDGRISDAAVEHVCLEIEREHADQFRSRRERLIRDVSQSLGKSAVRVGSESLRCKVNSSDLFIRLSARPPEPRDLYLLNQDCPIDGALNPISQALVAVKGGYHDNRDLTEWVCGSLKYEVRWREPQAVCSDPGVLEK